MFKKAVVKPLESDVICDQEKIRKKKRIEYLNSVTVHGLSRVYNGYKHEKIFWAAMLLVSMSFLFLGLYNLVVKYQSREIYLDIQNVIIEELKFPSVTICNNAREQLEYVSDRDIEDRDDITTAFSKEFYNFSKAFKGFCSFGDHRCIVEDFSTEGVEAQCVTFNNNGRYFQKLPGSHYGLSFIFHRKESDGAANYLDLEKSVVVVVHDQSESYSYYFDGSDLSPGVTTRIEITKKYTERLPSPFPSNCTHTGGGKDVFIYPGNYTHSLCLQSCFMREMYFTCGSNISPAHKRHIPASWKTNKTTKNAKEFNKCFASIAYRFATKAKNRCNCQTPCYETRYVKNAQSLRLNARKIKRKAFDAYFDTFHNNITDDIISSSFYHLQIFYPKLEYFIQTESPTYPLAQGLSDFGGQLGLAFGASALSIIELIVICILSFCARYNTGSKKNIKETSTN